MKQAIKWIVYWESGVRVQARSMVLTEKLLASWKAGSRLWATPLPHTTHQGIHKKWVCVTMTEKLSEEAQSFFYWVYLTQCLPGWMLRESFCPNQVRASLLLEHLFWCGPLPCPSLWIASISLNRHGKKCAWGSRFLHGFYTSTSPVSLTVAEFRRVMCKLT